mmetsp:Transcript_32340/g.78525  ORF Transcript_32340/g.78525 Transcript_32340/m.78525 type:complete len:265 (-) Transcript_32340:98-892(-)
MRLQQRTVRHVGAAHVEQPRHLVERRDERAVRRRRGDAVAQPRELLDARDARDGAGQRARGGTRRRWPAVELLPHAVDEVGIEEAEGAPLAERGEQLLRLLHRVEHRVDPHGGGGGQLRREVRLERWHAGLERAHQAPAGGQLLLRLQEVASVRPQQRRVLRDEHRPRAAGEAREVRAALVVRVDVLGEVWVGGGDEEGVDAGVGHRGAEEGELGVLGGGGGEEARAAGGGGGGAEAEGGGGGGGGGEGDEGGGGEECEAAGEA